MRFYQRYEFESSSWLRRSDSATVRSKQATVPDTKWCLMDQSAEILVRAVVSALAALGIVFGWLGEGGGRRIALPIYLRN